MTTASNIRWRILLILCLASFTSYTLRYNVSTATPFMIEDLGLTEIQWGWVLAAFAAGYAIFQFPGGVIGDRLGPRKALTIIAVLWSVLTIMTALVPGTDFLPVFAVIGLLVIIRFLVGAVHAPIFPVQNSSFQAWFPAGSWALPTGLSSTGLTLGVAATTPVLAWLLLEIGWRWSFVVISPVGLLVALVWYRYARDNPAEHPHVNTAELSLITAGKENQDSRSRPGRMEWLTLLKNRDILVLTLSYFCMNYIF